MRTYISSQLEALQKHRDFEYAIAAASNGDAAREKMISEHVDLIASFATLE